MIRRTRGSRGYSYQLLLQYNYEVDGEEYKSSRIVFGFIWGYQLIAREQQRRYPKGKRVDVYYFPDNPSMATLETTLQPETYMTLVGVGLICGMFLLFGG